MRNDTHFYVVKPRWSGLDRLYKIFVCRSFIAGARVGSQMSDRRLSEELFQQYARYFQRWTSASESRRFAAEEMYARMDLSSAQFLACSPHNFRLEAMDVRHIHIDCKWRVRQVFCGTLEWAQIDGARRRFKILRDQSVDLIAAELKRVFPGLQYQSFS